MDTTCVVIDRNFIAIIVFYAEELRAIDNGDDATQLLTANVRRSLHKKGITRVVSRGVQKGRKVALSPKARHVLQNLTSPGSSRPFND
jgi:hypothetical protein